MSDRFKKLITAFLILFLACLFYGLGAELEEPYGNKYYLIGFLCFLTGVGLFTSEIQP